MPTETLLSWPAALSLVAGVGLLYSGVKVWSFRDRPGAKFWTGVQISAAIWGISYGIAVSVSNPTIVSALQVPIWLGRNFSVPFIVAFAFEYTGRGHVVRSKLGGGLFAFYGLAFVLYATNPLHQFMLSDYRIDPLFGAAAMNYTPHAPLLIVTGIAYVLIGAALFLLLETVLNYGSLYRRQAILLVLAIGLPSVTNVAWLLRLPPTYHLDLTPVLFLFTALFGTYALFREEMFNLLPATRRIADRVAIDDLGIAIVILTVDARVIDFNDAAGDLLAADRSAVLTRPFDELIGFDLPLEATKFAVSDLNGQGREYSIDVSPIDGPSNERVGYTVTFQDITEERLRRQRLAVLNRILRHNLRNDMNVVRGNARIAKRRIAGTSEEAQTASLLQTIIDTSDELNQMGEKVWDVENALSREALHRTPVDVGRLCADVAEAFEARFPDAQISTRIFDGVHARTSETVLRLVVENVIENGVVHNEAEAPRIEVTVREADGSDGPPATVIEIEDDGPGIPEYELSALRRGDEDPLEHSSGIGLWIVSWSLQALDGDVSFSVDGDAGTTVSIRLPGSNAVRTRQRGEELASDPRASSSDPW